MRDQTLGHTAERLRAALPNAIAIYVFGSRASGEAGPESDLDLAVLNDGPLDPLALWDLSGDLADTARCAVDLVDLRNASTVLQHQIVTEGKRLFARDGCADVYEGFVLSEKDAFDASRAALIDDILRKGASMAGDVLINKAAIIERCVARARARAREEYAKGPASFLQDFTRQDAAILTIQRACEAALDMGQRVVRRDRLGVPQSARDVFTLLAQAGRIPPELADELRKMVGFRNLAVHDNQALLMPIVTKIITERLDALTDFSAVLLRREAPA